MTAGRCLILAMVTAVGLGLAGPAAGNDTAPAPAAPGVPRAGPPPVDPEAFRRNVATDAARRLAERQAEEARRQRREDRQIAKVGAAVAILAGMGVFALWKRRRRTDA